MLWNRSHPYYRDHTCPSFYSHWLIKPQWLISLGAIEKLTVQQKMLFMSLFFMWLCISLILCAYYLEYILLHSTQSAYLTPFPPNKSRALLRKKYRVIQHQAAMYFEKETHWIIISLSLCWGELHLAINSFIPLRVKELKSNENMNLVLNVKILSSPSRKVFSMQWMNIFSSRYQTSQLSIQSHRENWIADYFPNLGILWRYWVSLRGKNKWLIYLPKVKSTFPPDSLFTNSKSLMSIDG